MAQSNTSEPSGGGAPSDDEANKKPPQDEDWLDRARGTADSAVNWAGNAANWVGGQLFPSTNTPSPNASPAGQANTDFYQGLGGQRAGYQWTDPRQFGGDAQTRALQIDEAAAQGQAPSAAEQLFRKGADEGAASQLGLAATLQGSNPGQAMRAGLAGAQNVYAKTAADTAALRAQEMAQARDQFSTTAGAAREAQQRQLALENQFYLGLTDAQQRAQQAALEAEKQKTQNDVNARAGNQGVLGKLLGTAGSLLAS